MISAAMTVVMAAVRDFRRDDQRRDFRKDRDQRHGRRGAPSEFTREEKMEYREAKRGEYLSKPRRNSDGTMSFPSQNPYTHRRPGRAEDAEGHRVAHAVRR